MAVEKLVAICCRNENYDDFLNIAKRVHRLDPSIGLMVFSDRLDVAQLPTQLHHLRLLTLYLVNPPAELPRRGHTLCVKKIDKAQQYVNFSAAGISMPKTIPYQVGDTVNPDEWGRYVILKPTTLSLGVGVLLVPTEELSRLKQSMIPAGHPLHTESYLLQQFINDGPNGGGYRVLCFLGQPLMCYQAIDLAPLRLPTNIEECFALSPFDAGENERKRTLVDDAEVLSFARQAFNAHAECPLQGLDVIREEDTGKLYILENNSGGNVWSFSMKHSMPYRSLGRNPMVNQFKAWDRAAEVLVETTNRLAK